MLHLCFIRELIRVYPDSRITWAWQIGSRVGVTAVFPHLRKVAASSVPELGTGGQTWVID